MALEYKWTINNIKCYSNYNGLNNIVKNVAWTFTCTDIDTNKTASVNSNSEFSNPETENFIQYSDLTINNIISWIKTQFSVDNLKQELQNELSRLALPEETPVDLPFQTNELLEVPPIIEEVVADETPSENTNEVEEESNETPSENTEQVEEE
jgi:hypothetical protein